MIVLLILTNLYKRLFPAASLSVHFFSYGPDTSLMAERKGLPAFTALALVLAATAAVVQGY